MSEQESSPATAQAEAVEELLRQLVDARFVLTDRDGAVTRWSRPAEELFGWPSARMLGRPLVETLAVAGDLPELGGVVQTVARRIDGFPEAKLHAISHCILAHHGPDALPGRRFRSPEALALYRLNALDAGVKGVLEHGFRPDG